MTPSDSTRLERIAQLFERARPLDAAARAELLGAEDTSTRREVENLLERDEDAHELLDDPVVALTADGTFDVPPSETPIAVPDRIGPYRILDEIGVGGMGVVYRARQDRPNRVVALKVVRAPLTSARTVRRLRHEADLLGRLQHPGIAQIYEAGQSETPFGTQPYIAMEYVDGDTILTHAHHRELGTRARLGLFVRVCAAVHHAHQRGIVHRDLKPGNILVDGSGQPKVLDFGIARLLDPDGNETTLGTDVGQLLGTLPYMSPEQLSGNPAAIDGAADVYALGVILYELLTGELPHDVRSRPWPEAARLIREAAPTPLARVNRQFRGDLDTIMRKVLEKEPARRYASAADLASDIDRFLRSEPIIARPASTLYQLRKFTRRHRPVVAAIIALIVVLVAGVVTSTSLLVRTTRQAHALRRAIYGQNISLAQNAFDLNDMARMQEILYACDEDLRHWEWDRLSALADDSVAAIQAHRAPIGALAFSRDGSLIATGAAYDAAVLDAPRDRSVQVWDVERRTRRYDFQDHRAALRAVAWSADGRTLASGGSAHWTHREPSDGAVRLWGIEHGGLQERRGGLYGTDALAFDPDGRLYAGGQDEEHGQLVIAVWEPGEREPRLVPAHENGFWGMALAPDGRRLVTSDWGGRVSIWDAPEMTIVASHRFPPATRAVALDLTGQMLAVASDDFSVYILDAVSGAVAHRCVGHTDIVTDVEFSASGASILSSSADQTVRIWSAQTGELEGVRRGARGQVHALSVDPRGRYIAGGDSDGRVLLWSLDEQPFDRRLAHVHGEVNRVAWDPSGARLASAGDDATVRIWHVERGELLHVLRLDDQVIQAVAWSDDGELVAGVALSGRVGVWRPGTGATVAHWRGHGAVGCDLAFVPGTRLLVTCAREATLRLWDPTTGEPRGTFDAGTEIRALDVTADGSTLLAGGLDGTVHAWRLDDRAHRLVFDGGLRTEDVDVGPDGRTMVVAQAGHVRACDLRTGEVLWDVEAHRQAFAAGYSPEGARVVTAGDDGLIKILDAATGRRLLTLRAHAGRVRDARFDPTGRRIASAGRNEVVRVWESR